MIYFILPAYNEEKGVGFQLESIKKIAEKKKFAYRVIIINDGSIDRTEVEVTKFQDVMPISLLKHNTNMGVGVAFKTGFEEVLKTLEDDDIVITMDADNTQNLKTVELMVERINEGYEVILGSFFATGGMLIGVPLLRIFLTYWCNFLYRMLFHIKGVREYTGFYRAHSGEALKRYREKFGENIIESKGFVVMAEMLIKFRRMPFFITEVPMISRYDLKGGVSKLKIFPTIREHLKVIVKNVFKRRIV